MYHRHVSRTARGLLLIVVAGLVSGAACNGKGKSQGDGGGGTSGTGGGAVGTGGGTPITTCPVAQPTAPIGCSGSFSCQYNGLCRCGSCCYVVYACSIGIFAYQGAYDGCLADRCEDGGAGAGGSSVGGSGGAGGRGGAGGTGADASTAAVCTFGADNTCNDDPRISSIHGRCTDAGACACGDAGTNPDSGRCL